jgi:pyruvate ferredoxin oxidoreductase alpha subunit
VRCQIEGSQAVATAVARCRPEVVSAYPISPQTHIVEALSRMVRSHELAGCGFLNVESEFAAMSAVIGASAAGSRAYTATASQGLLYMAEAVFNAAGLGLPVVMTVANRAIGAPINIWNDHSDAMALRDCGWVQLYAADNQDAVDLHLLAFRLAEALSVPVMVCMDGFVLTHAFEEVDLPDQDTVDRYLPPLRPRQVLDPDEPVTIGAMVGPDAYTEVRYLAHLRHEAVIAKVPELAAELAAAVGRAAGGLVRPYRCLNADTVVVALGSVLGTLADVVDDRREAGELVGELGITTFRPFPDAAVRAALAGVRRVIVIERALAPGDSGAVTADVRRALSGTTAAITTVVAGLGGRPITAASLHRLLDDAGRQEPGQLTFLDLDHGLVSRQMARTPPQAVGTEARP